MLLCALVRSSLLPAYVRLQLNTNVVASKEEFSPPTLRPPTLEAIRAASDRLRPYAITTPLVPLDLDNTPGEIYLKLENLQAIGAFKVRPTSNVMLCLEAAERNRSVFTASSGNMGIAVAWSAARLGLSASVVVPDDASPTKLETITRLGAGIHQVSFEEWWQVIMSHRFSGEDGVFIDGVGDPRAIEGNATLGLEILQQLSEVDTILIPFGGGGLSSGVAAAARALKPAVRIIACESEMSTPLRAAFQAGEPVEVEYHSSFITGMGASRVLPWMWPLVRDLIDDTATVSLQQVADAIRVMAQRNHIVVEGAGAVPVAAALAGAGGSGKTVCVVSGGNINNADLSAILAGRLP